jgi:glycosyltransferase involved in cell wall biosynthesis
MAYVLAAQQSLVDAAEAVPEKLVSVMIPCLNEAENIEQCVTSVWRALELAAVAGEVVVADNDSDDGNAELAELAGAHVVRRDRCAR